MRRTISWVMGSAVLLVLACLPIHHPTQINPQPVAEQTPEPEVKSPEAREADEMVKMVGPLAKYVERQTNRIAGVQASPSKLHPSDRIGDSPVGTSIAILQKRFTIMAAQDFSFEIPAHAANPQLHGTYRAFAHTAGATRDESADVEFLLLNELQYQAVVGGQPSDALFSAPASHNQDVNFALPASSDRPVKYYLVFRNVPGGPARKIVHADFAVDF